MSKFISPGDIEGKLERKRNRFLLLLRKYPGISRQECAKRMSVSTFNITKLTPGLIKKRMVIEGSPPKSHSSKGRPSLPLRLNPSYEYYAGIDIEASQWRFAIIDFAGNMIYSKIEPFSACRTREKYISLLEDLLKKNIDECGDLWNKVIALGIGSPGFLNRTTGIIEDYEILPNFTMIPLLDIYRMVSAKTTCIINNISSLTVYDLWKRPESGDMTVLHVALRSGISASLNIKGQLYRGSHNRSGEIGFHIFPELGCLQKRAGLASLKKQLPKLPDEFWLGKAEAVNREYRKKQTRQTVDSAMKLLATALANVTAFLDPDEVIVYSTLFSEPNILWTTLQKEFERCRTQQHFTPMTFNCSGQSELNAAVGAALYALESSYPV